MAQINYGDKTISCKIVYYGPGLSGKTTNLQEIFGKTPGQNKGKMVSLATEGDRTLYFDFLPLDLGEIKGFKTKFQLYTVPGQVYYNATRKLVLKGVDAVVFIADSSASKLEENKESLQNLLDNLSEINLTVVKDIPFVIQYNKRDLPDAMSVEELRKELNTFNVPDFEAVAFKAVGIFKTLKAVAKLFIENFHRKYGFEVSILDAENDAFNSKSQQNKDAEKLATQKNDNDSELVKIGISDENNKKIEKATPVHTHSVIDIDLGVGVGYSGDDRGATANLDIENVFGDNVKDVAVDVEDKVSSRSFDKIELENYRENKSENLDDLEIEDINFESAKFSDDQKHETSDLEISEIGVENFSGNIKSPQKNSILMDESLDFSAQTKVESEDEFESDISRLKSELKDSKSPEIKPPQTVKQVVTDETKPMPAFRQTQKNPGQMSVSKSGTVIFAKKKKQSLFGKVFSMLSNKGD